jgi:hypothetical protein
MFDFYHEGTKYRVTFTHLVPFESQCRIWEMPPEGEHILRYAGYSSCSDKDQFSRRIGRKISLSRAISATPWDKEFRKTLWDMYFHIAGVSESVSYILTHVPDAENYSFQEALQEAEKRDKQAADNLLFSIKGE